MEKLDITWRVLFKETIKNEMSFYSNTGYNHSADCKINVIIFAFIYLKNCSIVDIKFQIYSIVVDM